MGKVNLIFKYPMSLDCACVTLIRVLALAVLVTIMISYIIYQINQYARMYLDLSQLLKVTDFVSQDFCLYRQRMVNV